MLPSKCTVPRSCSKDSERVSKGNLQGEPDIDHLSRGFVGRIMGT